MRFLPSPIYSFTAAFVHDTNNPSGSSTHLGGGGGGGRSSADLDGTPKVFDPHQDSLSLLGETSG
jgi:hypothetical protein